MDCIVHEVTKNGTQLSDFQEMQVQSLGQADSLAEENVTHSSILAWRIPWTEETEGVRGVENSQTRLSDSLLFESKLELEVVLSFGSSPKVLLHRKRL